MVNGEQIKEVAKQMESINKSLDDVRNMAVSRSKELDSLYPMKSMADMAERVDRRYDIMQGVGKNGEAAFSNVPDSDIFAPGTEQEKIAYASQAQATEAAKAEIPSPVAGAEADILGATETPKKMGAEPTPAAPSKPIGESTAKEVAMKPIEGAKKEWDLIKRAGAEAVEVFKELFNEVPTKDILTHFFSNGLTMELNKVKKGESSKEDLASWLKRNMNSPGSKAGSEI